MPSLERIADNPILAPRPDCDWEAQGTFNASVLQDGDSYHMVYRAQSSERAHRGASLALSTVAYAFSGDGIHFDERRQLIIPEEDWEAFGCEDPRVTRFEDTCYVFYTALSAYPFSPPGIKVGVALTSDFATLHEKHPVTTFNSKAMALFPARVSGKVAAVLTVHSDIPPAKIALALFDQPSDMWSPDYWSEWYANLDRHVIPLLRSPDDHVEVGAAPVETDEGWLLLYANISGYGGKPECVVFGIEAVLLDRDDPSRIIGRTRAPLLRPEAPYEVRGFVPRVAFPSGALVSGGKLWVYYGAADTTVALATIDLERLLSELRPRRFTPPAIPSGDRAKLIRYEGNPIILPRPELDWEAKATFNPAAFTLDGTVHILYRALSHDDTSVLGYATTRDGVTIEGRPTEPVYVPREPWEQKGVSGGGSGCEDPRTSLLDGRIYLLYTAYNGSDARVALSSIAVEDFLARSWLWEKPVLISAPEIWDKDACLFPRRIGGHHALLHRISVGIWVDLVDDLRTLEQNWLGGKLVLAPRPGRWDNRKIGAAGPPIETNAGWLLLYHGISDPGAVYRVGAALLDLEDPRRVIARSEEPVLEPEMPYEKDGLVPNVVFPCGTAALGDATFVYYGGADKVIGVANIDPDAVAEELLRRRQPG